MWKKEKDDMPAPMPSPRLEGTRSERLERAPAAPGQATIGRSITIRGEVTGDEDLLIQGVVEGSVDLKQHAVTVGPEGEVRADISARIVAVEGRVQGNLYGEEQVILRSSARVEGDIAAPRVVFEDGILFRGSVDMGEVTERTAPAASGKAAGQARAPEGAKTAYGSAAGSSLADRPDGGGAAELGEIGG